MVKNLSFSSGRNVQLSKSYLIIKTYTNINRSVLKLQPVQRISIPQKVFGAPEIQRQRQVEMDPNALERLKDLAISESGFLFDPYAGTTFSLNNTGKFILQLFMEGKGIEEIEVALKDKFEVGEEDLRNDIYEFVSLLKENHLLPNHFTP